MRGFHPLHDIEEKKGEIIGFLEDFFGNMFFEALPSDYEVLSGALDRLRDDTKDRRDERTFSRFLTYLPEGRLKEEVALLTDGPYSFCDGKYGDLRKWTFEGFDGVALSLVDYYSTHLSK